MHVAEFSTEKRIALPVSLNQIHPTYNKEIQKVLLQFT